MAYQYIECTVSELKSITLKGGVPEKCVPFPTWICEVETDKGAMTLEVTTGIDQPDFEAKMASDPEAVVDDVSGMFPDMVLQSEEYLNYEHAYQATRHLN